MATPALIAGLIGLCLSLTVIVLCLLTELRESDREIAELKRQRDGLRGGAGALLSTLQTILSCNTIEEEVQ